MNVWRYHAWMENECTLLSTVFSWITCESNAILFVCCSNWIQADLIQILTIFHLACVLKRFPHICIYIYIHSFSLYSSTMAWFYCIAVQLFNKLSMIFRYDSMILDFARQTGIFLMHLQNWGLCVCKRNICTLCKGEFQRIVWWNTFCYWHFFSFISSGFKIVMN